MIKLSPEDGDSIFFETSVPTSESTFPENPKITSSSSLPWRPHISDKIVWTGSRLGLMRGTIPTFAWRDLRKPRKSSVSEPVFGTDFNPGMPKVLENRVTSSDLN